MKLTLTCALACFAILPAACSAALVPEAECVLENASVRFVLKDTYVPMNEYTVHQTMLLTSFVWGYLAARKSEK